MYNCKYQSSGRRSLGPAGLCPAEVRSFITIHQVAPATTLLLLLLLLTALLVLLLLS